MANSSIAQIDSEPSNYRVFKTVDGIELVIEMTTGESFATQAGYARMSGLSKQAISKRCQGVNQSELKTTEVQTEGGLQGVHLIPAKIVFKWMIKDNPDLAEEMGECGATVYLHQLAGYKIESKQAEPKSTIALFEYQLAIAKEHEQRIQAIESSQLALERRMEAIQCEQARWEDSSGQWFSVLAYGKLHGIKLTLKQASALGRAATKVCLERDIQKETTSDPRFGTVGVYPSDVLDEVFGFGNP